MSDTAPSVEGRDDASVDGTPGPGSVWRVPGMPWLLGSAALWFSGFALLVSVAPLWVIHGGSDNLGAGLVTGVMMACTVLAQLSMRRVLAGLGWRWTLVLGSGLLGLPALGHLASDGLWAVAALAALRGLGFGVVTVCGATAVAAFVEPGRRGRAIGALGLSAAAPQFVLVPAAPWLAERVGFGFVFVLAVLPALAIPLAWPIARAVGEADRLPADGSGPGTPAAFWRAVAGPIAALVVVTASGGAILTFTPHILASPAVGFLGLLAFTGSAAASRWAAGGVADRFGPTPAIAPLLLVSALGLVAIAARADHVHDASSRVLVISGLLLVGLAYGGLQNLTLAQAFAAAGRAGTSLGQHRLEPEFRRRDRARRVRDRRHRDGNLVFGRVRRAGHGRRRRGRLGTAAAVAMTVGVCSAGLALVRRDAGHHSKLIAWPGTSTSIRPTRSAARSSRSPTSCGRAA